jgi:hypothetical protein
MATKNHNIRFNPSKEDELRAWEKLHSKEVEQMFKSKNSFVLQAINYYFDRCLATKDDPYLETREKEDAFVARIADMVDQKVLCNIPALAGMYLMQQQAFVSASMQSGVAPVMPQMNQQMQESKNDLNVDTTESNADVDENELVDFNIF